MDSLRGRHACMKDPILAARLEFLLREFAAEASRSKVNFYDWSYGIGIANEFLRCYKDVCGEYCDQG